MQFFLQAQSGATAIEYGSIAAAMALATAMPSITTALTGKLAVIGTRITFGKYARTVLPTILSFKNSFGEHPPAVFFINLLIKVNSVFTPRVGWCAHL
jgi:Flp pilus assembly pilin Flp